MNPFRIALPFCLSLATTAHANDSDPDTAFSGDGVAFAGWAGGPVDGTRVAVDAQGSVLVGGTITMTSDGDRDLAIARFASDGVLDFGFGFQGYRTVGFDFVEPGYDTLMGIFPLADGKVMLLGRAQTPAESIVAASPAAMARLTANGTLDTTFGSNGRRVFQNSPWPNAHMYFRAVARQPDGKFLFGGYCSNCPGIEHAVVLRTSATGEPDTSFGNSGWGTVPTPINPRLGALHVDARGRIVLGGVSFNGDEYHTLLVRMTRDGHADTSFGANGSGVARPLFPAEEDAEWTVTSLASDHAGALYLGMSNFGPVDGGPRGGVARLNADGSRDMSYGLFGLHDLTRENGSRIETIALRNDGRLVAAGSIITNSNRHDFYVARLLPSGGLDPAFDGNGVARYPITDTQNDALAMTLAAGKPVIAGTTYVTGSSVAVLRLKSDLIFADGVE